MPNAPCAFALRAALTGEAGSRNTGDPSPAGTLWWLVVAGRCQRTGEAGIGERLRSDEVPRGTTKLLPAPPMNHPQARETVSYTHLTLPTNREV